MSVQNLILEAAKYSVSAHNVQPFRFHFISENRFDIYTDEPCLLPAADPHEKDLRMSLGALMCCLQIALQEHGYDLKMLSQNISQSADKQPYAQIQIESTTPTQHPLQKELARRFSYRGFFRKNAPQEVANDLANKQNLIPLIEENSLQLVARLYSELNIKFMLKKNYIEELFSWMRFNHNHPRWSLDGLSSQSLALSKIESLGASVIMHPAVFRFLAKLKIIQPLIDESTKITTAPYVIAITCPRGTSDFQKGVLFFKKWLELTSLNIYGNPLSLLTDDPPALEKLSQIYRLPKDDEFVNFMRCGFLPDDYQKPQPARLTQTDLIWRQ